MSLINTHIKPFKAQAYKDGKFIEVTDADVKGKWSVFFFYPADFTFVCPTELEDLADHYDEFKKLGRLGCPQCYVAFEPHLKGLLRRLHNGTQHLGKVYLPPDPSQAERQERLAGLRRKLDRAVESEDFERAAQIRDMIRTLEGVA